MALWNCLTTEPDSHPVAALPTGSGKTVVISKLIKGYLHVNPGNKVLVISHTEDIVLQDSIALDREFAPIKCGVYAAGLNRRELKKITVATIHSIYRIGTLFKDYNLVIIDEAHAIPFDGEGMYRRLFSQIKQAQYCGVSATCFRQKGGYIYGEDRLFNKIVSDWTTKEKYNQLVREGFICKMVTKQTKTKMNTDNAREQNGDFLQADLSRDNDIVELNERIVKETVKNAASYKKWLVFCIDIDHAEHINELLNTHGISTELLHSRTIEAKRTIINRFRDSDTKALVSVGMIVTGFDLPEIDLLVIIRPTTSLVLHVQMIGRGSRIAKGKDHCLVMDYGGNLARLGPINEIEVNNKKKKTRKNRKPLAKACPSCGAMYGLKKKVCDECGHEFTFKSKLYSEASRQEVFADINDIKYIWLDVSDILYMRHIKEGSPDSMRVHYICNGRTIKEWICYDHLGYAGDRAKDWVISRYTSKEYPDNVSELLSKTHLLRVPKKILVESNFRKPVPKIIDYTF